MMVFWKVLEILGVFFFIPSEGIFGGDSTLPCRLTAVPGIKGRGEGMAEAVLGLGGCLGHSVHGKSWGT